MFNAMKHAFGVTVLAAAPGAMAQPRPYPGELMKEATVPTTAAARRFLTTP